MEKDFLTITPDSGGGNGSLNVAASANDGDARSSSVIISGSGVTKTVPVTQEANPIALMFGFAAYPLGVGQDVSSSMIINAVNNPEFYFVNASGGGGRVDNTEYSPGIWQIIVTTSMARYAYGKIASNSIFHIGFLGTSAPPLVTPYVKEGKLSFEDLILNLTDVTGSTENIRTGFYNPSSLPTAQWTQLYGNWNLLVSTLKNSAEALKKKVNLTIQWATGGTFITATQRNALLTTASGSSYFTLKFVEA